MRRPSPATGPLLWKPQPGPQFFLLTCPIREIFYGGARGGGKTDGALGHWMQHERTYGAHALGIVFRRRYKQLDRVIQRGKQLFGPLGAKFHESKDHYWFQFPSGARLLMRHLNTVTDADEYQGWETNWLCFEEIVQWPDPTPIDMMRATLRSSVGVPCWFLATGNPGGPGTPWVKERYIDPAPPYTPMPALDDEGQPYLDELGQPSMRVFIPAKITDNPALLSNDPRYVTNLYQSGPAWLVRAWLAGDWNVIAGGFLEGIWKSERHIVKPFQPPLAWPRWRAMDWGFARPYSIGWYCKDPDGRIYRYRELYGYGGKANRGTRESADQVAREIVRMEAAEIRAGCRFIRNPADTEIWAERGVSITVASLMADEGVRWARAKKGPGSRRNSAQVVVSHLRANTFAVTENCRHFIRTVPIIPADPEDPEEVDTEAEDHVWDEFCYSLVSRHRAPNPPPPGRKKAEPTPSSSGDLSWIRRSSA